ncbi:MAG: FRG domain-containing protein [Treponema sp.]|nr:FRG domain-containing protein [Treponema sp.]
MKENAQEKAFREMLPENIRGMFESITFGYQDFLLLINGHLKTIYGERADLQNCLDAYFNGAEYREAFCKGDNINKIKLLKPDDIYKMIYEERQYSSFVNEAIKCFNEMNTSSDTKEINIMLKLSIILGLLPEKNENSLFQWLINKEGISFDENEELYKKIKININLLDIISNTIIKFFIPGFLLKFPSVGCVMTQQRGKYYYRGENAFYKTSKASLYRNDNKLHPAVKIIVERLRLYETWNFLDNFNSIKHWGGSAVNYMALAQHYGLHTQMIDITSDLKTAIFFACCKFGKDRKWHPLSKDDFEHANSRKNIAALGGDSRYGILYRTPAEITDLKWALADRNAGYNIITPVGYQPFMRCSHQYSYMFMTDNENYDMLKDPFFCKYKIRLTEELCNWIYNEMDNGNKVYPNDEIPDISQYIEKINNQTVFSESVFQCAFEKHYLMRKNIENFRKFLSDNGVVIIGKQKFISGEKLEQINSSYTIDDAIKRINLEPQLSPLMIMQGIGES